jgi:hypothetical protein
LEQQDVQEAMMKLEALGLKASLENIRALTGGSPRDIVKFRRRLLAPAAPVAETAAGSGRMVVPQEEPAETPLPPRGNGMAVAEEAETTVPRMPAAKAAEAVISPATPQPRLFMLRAAVQEADATLRQLQYQRDVQQTAVQVAALAYHQGLRQARELITTLRHTTRYVHAAPPHLVAQERAKAAKTWAALADLVGEAEACRVAGDPGYRPAWLREG